MFKMVAIKVKMFVTFYVTISVLQVFNVVLAAPQQGLSRPSYLSQPSVSGLANGLYGGSYNVPVGGSANVPVGGTLGGSPNGPVGGPLGGTGNVPVGGSFGGSANVPVGGSANVPVGGTLGGSANGPVGGTYDGSAGVQEANGQQSSIPWNMINQSRQQFKDTLMTTGANRVIDTIDTANLGMQFFDNRMGEITELVHSTMGTADGVARKKAQLASSLIEMGGGGFGGLMNGAQQIGGAGVGAVKGVYDGAVGTTANTIRMGGRLAALPLKITKGATGILGGERRQPINNLYQMPTTASRKYLSPR